jgi:glycosyltransferase involved in cell wall biosynthesis
MPGRHVLPEKTWPRRGKFRLVYVGSVENFYGRMLCSLIEQIEASSDLEIIVVGPNADWPKQIRDRALANGTYLGFKPPEEAAKVLASADAFLVVMSFEKEHELFMRTSFTTKFLDYVSFGKPVILWGPEYCTPVRVAHEHGGAAVVSTADARAVVDLCRKIARDPDLNEKLSKQALQLHQTLFNPDRLQDVFVQKITELVDGRN